MKRLTIEFVRSEFEKKGWVLTSTEYINSITKLDYICSEGHLGFIRWGDWQQGHGCPLCAGNNIKHTIDFIKKEFEKREWVCISTEYINAHSKLDCICPNGHLGSIRWADLQQGYGRLICSGKKKHTIGFIKSEFEMDEYILNSKEYINAHTKLDYICPKGHHGSITWGNWQQGQRCSICDNISRVGIGNSNWKGGISKEPYCQNWTRDLKVFVKERDNYKCLNPYCNSKNPDKLSVHHIDYNKKSCGPDNLITICRSCNCKANFNREWHESWYKAILYRRYNIKNNL